MARAILPAALRCIAVVAVMLAACATAAPAPTVIDGQVMRADGACPALAAEPVAGGWQPLPTLCAWQGRLQLRRWTSAPEAPGSACVGPAALWWSWERRGLAPQGAAEFPVWQAGWRSNAALMIDPMRIAVIEAGNGGAWSASEWRWSPPPGAATRAWEAARWERLSAAARAKRAPPGTGAGPAEAEVLRAWQSVVRDRPAEISASAIRWLAGEQCLRLVSQLPPEPDFHLAFTREDARLEQRAAMQVQLARRYPDATWLIPFGLLDNPGAASAKVVYVAVWQDKSGVTGQLWLPETAGRRPVRLRILATPGKGTAALPLAQLIGRELAALAQRLGADHER